MNLIKDPWIAVRRHNGDADIVTPAQVVAGIVANPIISLDERRPDFNGALAHFLIGLLQTGVAPQSGEWGNWYENPPTVEALERAFRPFEDAFELFGAGSRFMQDEGVSAADPKDIAALFLEAPGGNTLRNNADHFIKQGGVDALSPANAALALLTLQINAPAGGKGFRTSLRGGGPLTTLVVPDPQFEPAQRQTLWHFLWLNVLDQDQLQALMVPHGDAHDTPADIFPWLAPCRGSDPQGAGETRPGDAHLLQTYWACPRRIWLEPDPTPGRCSLSGQEGPVVSQIRTRNYGVNYQGPWEHLLSPYYRTKEGEWLPLHPQPGGIGYRHWSAYVLAQGGAGRAAAVVRAARNDFDRPERTLLWAFGYDMDNMKARAWYEAWMPIMRIEEEIYDAFQRRVEELLLSAQNAADALRGAIKEAWFRPGLTVRGDLNAPVAAFWAATEAAYYETLRAVIEALRSGVDDGKAQAAWFAILRTTALKLFDEWAASGDVSHENPKRLAKAQLKLQRLLDGKAVRDILIPRDRVA